MHQISAYILIIYHRYQLMTITKAYRHENSTTHDLKLAEALEIYGLNDLKAISSFIIQKFAEKSAVNYSFLKF